MTNKSTKRALLSSALALFLCFAMLLSTTFAWFTDSVSTGSNVIQTGNLDIEVEYTLDGKTWNALDGAADLFQKGLWEPGHTEVVALKISNKGSLALKYTAMMNLINETAGKTKEGNDIVLSEILTVSTLIQQANIIGDIAVMLAFMNEVGVAYETNSAFKNTNVLGEEKTLEAGDEQYLIIKVDMDEKVGNEANHNGVNIPTIEFGINIFATQNVSETDSFGNSYDINADYVAYYTDGTHDLNMALAATSSTDVVTAEGANTVVNIIGGYYDALDKDCAVWAKDGATVNISGGVFVHNGEAGVVATPDYHYDMIYAGANGAKINISGGTFYARNGGVWLLNEKDNQGEIVVTGGTFINWNPANNDSEGAGTNFLAPGYEVTTRYTANGDIEYKVVKKNNTNSTGTGGVFVESNTNVTIENTTINSGNAGLENDGNVTIENTEINAGSTGNYATINKAETVYNNVYIVSAGGGIGASNGANVVFNSGSVEVDSTSTSGRYVFYASGAGTTITINGGDFNFDTDKTLKRAYIYAAEGTTVIVNGGNFGAPSTRADYKAGIMGSGTVIIKGGTFGFDPTNWLADGYTAVKTTEGKISTWTVVEA